MSHLPAWLLASKQNLAASQQNELLVSQRLANVSSDVKVLNSRISDAHRINRLFNETTSSNKHTSVLKPKKETVIRNLEYLPSDVLFVVLTFLTVGEIGFSLVPSSKRLMHYLIRSVHYFTHMYGSEFKYLMDQPDPVLPSYLRRVDLDRSPGLGWYTVKPYAAIMYDLRARMECGSFLDFLGKKYDEGKTLTRNSGSEGRGGGGAAGSSSSSSSKALHVQRVVNEMRYVNSHLDMLLALTMSPVSPVGELFCASQCGPGDVPRRDYRNVGLLLSLVNAPKNSSSADVVTGNANVVCDIIANLVCWDKIRLVGAPGLTLEQPDVSVGGQDPAASSPSPVTVTGQIWLCSGHRMLTRFLTSPAASVNIVSSSLLSVENVRSYSAVQGGGSKEASRALCNLYSDRYPCPPCSRRLEAADDSAAGRMGTSACGPRVTADRMTRVSETVVRLHAQQCKLAEQCAKMTEQIVRHQEVHACLRAGSSARTEEPPSGLAPDTAPIAPRTTFGGTADYFYDDFDADEEVLVNENMYRSNFASSNVAMNGLSPCAPAAQSRPRTCVALGRPWYGAYYTKSGALNQDFKFFMNFTTDYGLRGYGEDNVGRFVLDSNAPHVDISSDHIWLINKTYLSVKDIGLLATHRPLIRVVKHHVELVGGAGTGKEIPSELEIDAACFFFQFEHLQTTEQLKFNNGNGHIGHTAYWSPGLGAVAQSSDCANSAGGTPLEETEGGWHYTGFYGVWEAVSREKHLDLQKGGVFRMAPLPGGMCGSDITWRDAT